MTLTGKWISDLEVDAIKHLIDRGQIEAGGLSVLEMNAMARLSRKGFVTFSAMKGGTYRPTVALYTALTDRAIRKGIIKVDRAQAVQA